MERLGIPNPRLSIPAIPAAFSLRISRPHAALLGQTPLRKRKSLRPAMTPQTSDGSFHVALGRERTPVKKHKGNRCHWTLGLRMSLLIQGALSPREEVMASVFLTEAHSLRGDSFVQFAQELTSNTCLVVFASEPFICQQCASIKAYFNPSGNQRTTITPVAQILSKKHIADSTCSGC